MCIEGRSATTILRRHADERTRVGVVGVVKGTVPAVLRLEAN